MALDQQRNWTIAMADNLEQVKRMSKKELGANRAEGKPTTSRKNSDRREEEKTKAWVSEPVYLPDEIVIQILDYVASNPAIREAQGTLASCCLLSQQWHAIAVPYLYRRPYLYGKNFDLFVRVISPSINLHIRKSPLSEFVRTLNMANLVHQQSKSMTARLLGRTKNNLEEFVAPQASFATNCFPALSKCQHLRHLDLSLVYECPPLPELFKRVCLLHNLRVMRLPRAAGLGPNYKEDSFKWPPNLEDLSLSGGIDAHFLHGIATFPQSLRHLTIEHCPSAKANAVNHLLRVGIRPLVNLITLTIRFMPRLSSHALDGILLLLPQLETLSISVDYITPALFDDVHLHPLFMSMDDAQPSLRDSKLRTLELTSSGNPGTEDKVSPVDILIAVDEGSLPKLRKVRVARQLHWHSPTTSEDLEHLADVLQERSRADWEDEHGRAGVGAGGDDGIWEKVAGVWIFDG